MIYFENVDGRVCILFPYLGRVLLGSTDIRVDKPGDVRCEDDEVDYILKSLVLRLSGHRGAARGDRLPLQRRAAAAPQRRELHRAHLARPFRRGASPGTPPVLCLVGGKWTTFRAFGAQAADRGAGRFSACPRTVRTEDRRIGGGAGFPRRCRARALVATLAAEFGVSPARAAHAGSTTTAAAPREVARLLPRRPRQPIRRHPAYTEVGARYLIRHEHARTPRRPAPAPHLAGDHRRAVLRGHRRRPRRSLADELGWSQRAGRRRGARLPRLLARDHGLTEPFSPNETATRHGASHAHKPKGADEPPVHPRPLPRRRHRPRRLQRAELHGRARGHRRASSTSSSPPVPTRSR